MADLLERLRAALADRYRVDREVGRGGMALVFFAHDLKLDRPVALKVLRPDLAASLGADRFLREIEIVARLTHPNILPLHDCGKADGQLYYTMPFVEGESLRNRLDREKQLPIDDALRIAREVADALGHAHALGIVHRDIKPENILFSAGHAVVSDFGIARAVSAAGVGTLTETGLAVGTPAYMSPEQASGPSDIDGRSDIYALGCVLYEMLSGETPYLGRTPQAIVAKKLTEPPPRVSVVRETVPIKVEEALVRALARTPADRFRTAQGFAEALSTGAILRRAPLHGWRRAAALVVTFGVLALAVRGLHSMLAETGIHKLAVLPLTDLTNDSAQAYLADGVQEALTSELGQLGLSVTARATMVQFRNAHKPIREVAREVGADAVIEGSVYRSHDSLQISTRLYDKDEREIWAASYAGVLSDVVTLYRGFARAMAHEIGVRLNPTNEARLSETRTVNPHVYEAYLRGMHLLDNPRTDADLDSAIASFQQAVDQNPADPLAYAGLALGYTTIGHGMNPPDDVWPRARAAAERAIRLDSTLADAWAALATIKTYAESDWEGAERAFRRANELNPSLAMNHYHYAWYLALFGRVDEALVEHRRAQELDPLTPLHTVWIPQLYWFSEKPDMQRALTEARLNVKQYPDNATAWTVLAGLAQAAGLPDEWRAATERALALEPEDELGRAALFAQTGRREDALRIAEKYETRPPNGWHAYQLAGVYGLLGYRDKSLHWAEYEPHHAWVAWAVGWASEKDRADPRMQALARRLNLQFVPGQRAPRPLPVEAQPLSGTVTTR